MVFMLYNAGFAEAGNDELMKKVMTLIEEEEYAHARFVWCRDIMGMGPGHHNMYSSIEDNFSKWCQHLFTFTTTFESTCSSDFCPVPKTDRVMQGRSDVGKTYLCMFPPSHCKLMDQGALDGFFDASEGPCDMVPSQGHFAANPPEVFRKMMRQQVETEELEEWWQCAGKRHYHRRSILTYPLVLNILFLFQIESRTA